jgi:hypothetical protein
MANFTVYLKNNSTADKYALQVEKLAITITKNPIQIAAPKMSPYLFDLGTYKPIINVIGISDDQSTSTTESFLSETYRTPTAYQISRMSTDWWYDAGQTMYLYILMPATTVGQTTYFRYTAALQQVSLDYGAASEERPSYSMSFVSTRAASNYPHYNAYDSSHTYVGT